VELDVSVCLRFTTAGERVSVTDINNIIRQNHEVQTHIRHHQPYHAIWKDT